MTYPVGRHDSIKDNQIPLYGTDSAVSVPISAWERSSQKIVGLISNLQPTPTASTFPTIKSVSIKLPLQLQEQSFSSNQVSHHVSAVLEGERTTQTPSLEASTEIDRRGPFISIDLKNYSEKGFRFNHSTGRRAFIETETKRLTSYPQYWNIEKLTRTKGELLKIEATNESGGVSSLISSIDAKGVLSFEIETVSTTAEIRGPINGKCLFRRMMEFHNNSIKEIEGIWVYGTNLDLFSSQVAIYTTAFLTKHDGQLPNKTELQTIYKAAAKQTWTGRRAEEYGFGDVKSVSVTIKQGKITAVNATFVMTTKVIQEALQAPPKAP
ncbi:MAG: hypothetical protein WCG42_05955 [Parachlamydiaceae bacterium]